MPLSVGGSQGTRRKKRVSITDIATTPEAVLAESERQRQAMPPPEYLPAPEAPLSREIQIAPPYAPDPIMPELPAPRPMMNPGGAASSLPSPMPSAPTGAVPEPGPSAGPMPSPQFTLKGWPPIDTARRNTGENDSTSFGDEEKNAIMQRGGAVSGEHVYGGGSQPFGGGSGTEPFDNAAFMEEQDNRRNWLEMARGIGEGLGNMNLTSAGHIRAGLSGTRHGQEPYIAEGIRKDIARNEDRISPNERGSMQSQWGWDPGEDASFSRSMDVTGQMARGRASEASMLAQQGIQSRFDASEERRLEQQALQEKKEDRLSGADKRADWKAHLLPNAVLKEGAVLKFTNKMAHKIEEQYDAIRTEVGPLWSRWQKTIRTLPLPMAESLKNPEVIALQANLVKVLGSYLTAQTGAQRGMVEVRFLEVALPMLEDENFVFDDVMEQFKIGIRDELETKIEVYKRAGYDITPLLIDGEEVEEPVPTNQTPGPGGTVAQPAGGGDLIEVRNPDTGQVVPLRADLAEEAVNNRGWEYNR